MNIESFDIEELKNLSHSEQIKIKKEVIKNYELANIPIVFLPDVITKEYYFISYSHKNYKEVYSDLFDLSEMGLGIWYDRGIPAGSSWKDTAVKYLAPFDCKGVIFYISEEALISNAIKDEIKFTKENEKPFIVILLDQQGNLDDLINRLFEEKKITEDDYRFYKEVFPSEVIYLKYSDPKQTKYEKIINSIPKQKLLNLDIKDNEFASFIHSFKKDENSPNDDDGVIDEVFLAISDINDHYVSKITMFDFLDVVDTLFEDAVFNRNEQESLLLDNEFYYELKFNKYTDKVRLECEIKDAAFAHLKNLEYVELPTKALIRSNAFFGCSRLKEVKLIPSSNQYIYIGEQAFANCASLTSIDLSKALAIGRSAFENCNKLTEVNIVNDKNGKHFIDNIGSGAFYDCINLNKIFLDDHIIVIGSYAFHRTHLEKLVLPKDLEVVEEAAFKNTDYLKQLVFNDKLRIIEDEAFAFSGISNREKLEIKIPNTLEKMGYRAFFQMPISKITYNGKFDDFINLAKDNFTVSSHEEILLVCLDKSAYIKHLY